MSELIDLFASHCQHKPSQEALSLWHHRLEHQKNLNYHDFSQSVYSVASALRTQANQGDRILLLFEPDIDFAIAFWACLVAGMVAVPTYPPGDPRTRERFFEIAKDSEAKITLTSAKILKQSRVVRWFIGSLRRMQWLSLDALQEHKPETMDPVPAEQLALLQYTSGSTDKPRGVMLSHNNLQANVQALSLARQTSPNQREHFVCWVPLYHDMGLISGVVMPLALGHSSTLLSPLHFLQQPLRWLKAISEKKGTISAGPNFAYELCLRRISDAQIEGLDLSSWRVALNGAENISPETLERFAERFAVCGFKAEALYPSYGLAESTVFVSGNPSGQKYTQLQVDSEALSHNKLVIQDHGATRALVGLGHCWNQGEILIVNPETKHLCPENQIGEIWISGPSVGQGYWKKPEASKESFQAYVTGDDTSGPWMRSGDLGFVHEGQLYITGRIKELIIVHGQNYYPQPIEQAVQSASKAFRPGNGAAFSLGFSPEKLVVVQEIRKQSKADPEDLKRLAIESVLTQIGLPLHDFLPVAAGKLPKTSSGKLQRSRCRDLYLKGKFKQWKP